MTDAIIVALISGSLLLIGTIATAIFNNVAMKKELEKQSELADARLATAQAVTDTKLEELTREVRKHNNFAERIPVIEEQIKVANHRIDDLEKTVSTR